MAEERRNPGSAIQMAGAFSLALHTVDFTSPFAEHTSPENAIQKLDLEIQETELWSLDSFWRDLALLSLLQPFEKFQAQSAMFLPQLRFCH
jgi:hypothetical protein